jgi:acyl carrier protein
MIGRDEVGQRLARFLLDTGRITQANLDANSALITSGLIDSVTLFNLALWIEEVIGKPVDLSRIALPEDWDTLDAILGYIERQQA